MRRPIEVDFEEEVHAAAQQMKRGLRLQVLLIAVILAAPLAALLWNGGPPAIDWQEDRVILNYPDKTTAGLAFADISAFEYRESFDFGSPVTGGTADGYRYGLWNSGEFGDYQTYCQEDVPGCIVITVPGIRFVVNAESQESTRALYASMREALADGGYLET